MKTFVLIFHGYDSSSPDLVAAWEDWFQRRSASFKDVGHMFGPGRQITNETTIEWSLASNPASGYSIVVAPHIDAAEQLLEGCPIVRSVSLYEALPSGVQRWAATDPPSSKTWQYRQLPVTASRRALNQNGRKVLMRNIKIERTVNAPRASVWAVLADYPNISAWNDGVQNSFAIGDAVEGVGAQRQCELTPSGAMRETVSEWVPEEKMVIAIDQIQKIPVNDARMTFTLADRGENTSVTMSYDYEPKGGPFGFVVAAMLGKPMNKGFNGFLDSLERAAQAQTAG